MMALTKEFKDTVMELCKNPEYRKALLHEALESYLEGDIAVGNSLVRDYLNGSQGFLEVSISLKIKESGLRRMVSPVGNPTAKNFFQIFNTCLKRENIAPSSFVGV
jgi:DNA-binding phage protein